MSLWLLLRTVRSTVLILLFYIVCLSKSKPCKPGVRFPHCTQAVFKLVFCSFPISAVTHQCQWNTHYKQMIICETKISNLPFNSSCIGSMLNPYYVVFLIIKSSLVLITELWCVLESLINLRQKPARELKKKIWQKHILSFSWTSVAGYITVTGRLRLASCGTDSQGMLTISRPGARGFSLQSLHWDSAVIPFWRGVAICSLL